jgi:hypothetical protein
MVTGPPPDDPAVYDLLCAADTIGCFQEELTAAVAREAVTLVLADATYRADAERVRDELAALPGPEYAAALLERLAAERRPVRAAR